jgi:hypothetical protein
VARGWESKSIEEQQAAAQAPTETRKLLTPEQVADKRQRDSLLLSRKRIVEQLQAAQNPHYRQMLESTLAELDGRLARLV